MARILLNYRGGIKRTKAKKRKRFDKIAGGKRKRIVIQIRAKAQRSIIRGFPHS